jgi:hypothetical protein
MDTVDRFLFCLMSFFNLYLLWRINLLEDEKTSVQDIRYIFEILLDKLGVYERENDESEN